MKKAISIILNILSITAAAVLLVIAFFCAYDWVEISASVFAYSIDFWLVIDIYAIAMLISCAAGLLFAVPNYIISRKNESYKKTRKLSLILTVVFAVCAVLSVVLYLLPFDLSL